MIESKEQSDQSLTSFSRSTSTQNSQQKNSSLPRLLPPAEAPVQPLRPRPAPRQRPNRTALRGLDPHHLRSVPGLRPRPEGQARLCGDVVFFWCCCGVFRLGSPCLWYGLVAVRSQPGNDRRDLSGLDGDGVELLHEARVGDRPREKRGGGCSRRGRERQRRGRDQRWGRRCWKAVPGGVRGSGDRVCFEDRLI